MLIECPLNNFPITCKNVDFREEEEKKKTCTRPSGFGLRINLIIVYSADDFRYERFEECRGKKCLNGWFFFADASLQ